MTPIDAVMIMTGCVLFGVAALMALTRCRHRQWRRDGYALVCTRCGTARDRTP
jgi:hypothetical protein